MKQRKNSRGKPSSIQRDDRSLPRSTHTGTVELFGVTSACYVLDDGRRLISQRGVNSLFFCPNGGRNELGLPRFVLSPTVAPFLGRLREVAQTRPVSFIDGRSGRSTTAIDTTLVIDVCEAWLNAWNAGAIETLRELAIARRATTFLRGVARYGVVGLVEDTMHCERVSL